MSMLIDADALIEEIRERGIYGSGYSDAERENDVIDRIESQPTIEAVPVVEAEWISTGDAELDNIYSGYKCSACGYMICGNAPNFCGGCGAKMKGGAE